MKLSGSREVSCKLASGLGPQTNCHWIHLSRLGEMCIVYMFGFERNFDEKLVDGVNVDDNSGLVASKPVPSCIGCVALLDQS